MTKTCRIICLAILISFSILTACEMQPKKHVAYTGFGGQKTVSGSMHVLDVSNRLHIIDVGIFYGEDGENYPLPDIDIERIGAVLITHAHADHIGRLPLLLHKGYQGPIYMTEVTYDIAKIVLASNISYVDFGIERFYYSKHNESNMKPVYMDGFDFGRFQVQPQNKVYINYRRNELNDNGYYMSRSLVKLLEEELLAKLERQVQLVDFNNPFFIEDLLVEFLPTSHIPGSAMIKLKINDTTYLFSGDIGSDNNPFLESNKVLDEPVDFLFIEGTYGVGNLETDYAQRRLDFRKTVGEKVAKGYRIIIPAFVLDRTQQVLNEIRIAMEDGYIPADTIVKVYSPTSEKITDLYRSYSSSEEKYRGHFNENMSNAPFAINNLRYNPKNSDKTYNTNIKYGEIAIMSSGMASEVFSKEAVKQYIEDDRTIFLLNFLTRKMPSNPWYI